MRSSRTSLFTNHERITVPLDVDGVLIDREEETLGLAASNVGTRVYPTATGPTAAVAVASPGRALVTAEAAQPAQRGVARTAFLCVTIAFVVRDVLCPRRVGGPIQTARVLSRSNGGAGDAPVVLQILRQRPVAGLDRRAQIIQLRFDLKNKGLPSEKISETIHVQEIR